MSKEVKCPVCDATMRVLDVPQHNLQVCSVCTSLVQVLEDDTVVPMDAMLARSAMGDDRVRAAISQPRVASVKSFVDVLDNSIRAWRMDLGSNLMELRGILVQAQNRLDFALRALSGMDLALPEMGEVLDSIREARDLVSTLPASSRGVTKENEDDLSAFTIQTATPVD